MKFTSAIFAAALLAGSATIANASSDDASELLVNASFSSFGTASANPEIIMDRDGDRDHDGREGREGRDNDDDGYEGRDNDDRGRGRKRRRHHDNDD